MRNVRKPRDAAEALRALEDAAVSFVEADPDDERSWDERRDVLWRAAIACARATGDVRAVYHERWKKRQIARVGLEAFRAAHREAQRRYRARRSGDGGVAEVVPEAGGGPGGPAAGRGRAEGEAQDDGGGAR
jgi:hypothetical protein